MHRPAPLAARARSPLEPPPAGRAPVGAAAPACRVPGLALAAALAVALAGPAQAAASSDAVVLYRSTMPDGRVVIGDRPEPGAGRVQTIGSVPAGDRVDVVRARQEREYWRQRAEAFAARHAQRQRELDTERDERGRLAERERALYAARVLVAPPIVYGGAFGAVSDRLGLAGLPIDGAYATSPGAAGRNLGALGSTGVGFGAPFGLAPGAGLGGVGAGGFAPGAAPGASFGFIGSGFATSGR